jgi:hypothetical protein
VERSLAEVIAAMTATLILVAFALVGLALFVLRPPNRAFAGDEESLLQKLVPVDLDAFRNLVDPEEELFLRSNMSAPDFRALQRERMRAAVDYVSGVSRNAGVLLQLGMAARRSPSPQVAEAGRHLVDNAVRLRMYALMAAGKFYTRMAFPGTSLEPAGIVNHYQEMSNWAALLGRLQRPEKGALVSRAL